jgi:hypothetical protein
MSPKPATLFVLVIVLLASSSVFSQSTIMNTPSTDVVAARKVYVEMDGLSNMVSTSNNADEDAGGRPRGCGRN